MNSNSKNASIFRHDINALRAIAIIGVILFHYKIAVFSGGFAGVDVFFVISGYLITKITIVPVIDSRFSYRDYIFKRVKRIIPALLFLVITLSLVCFFLYLPTDYRVNQRNAAASIVFLSNILYWQDAATYFAPSSDTNIFLHTWSLSVEWQFYIIYPIFLIALKKILKSLNRIGIAFIICTFSFAIISIIIAYYKNNAAFYLLPTRAWEMMFGGVAFFAEGKIKKNNQKLLLSVIGYSLIIVCFMLYNIKDVLWPSFYTVVPVSATSLIIAANYNHGKFIKNRIIQFIGKTSYSIYLWHWPIFVIAQYFGIKTTIQSTSIYFLLSVFLGYVSYRYIESYKGINVRLVSFCFVLVFAIVFISKQFQLNSFVFENKTLAIANYDELHKKDTDKQLSRGICFIDNPQKEVFDNNYCLCLKKNSNNVLLIGDSHAAQLSESLNKRFDKMNIHVLQATVGATFPAIHSRAVNNEKPQLKKIIDYMYDDFIPKNVTNINGVIITAYFSAYELDKEQMLVEMKTTVDYFIKHKINVIIVGQTESYMISYPSIAAKNFEYGVNITDRFLNENNYAIDGYLENNLKPYYIKVINSSRFPELLAGNIPYMFDSNHSTNYGANLIIDKIVLSTTGAKFINNVKSKKYY